MKIFLRSIASKGDNEHEIDLGGMLHPEIELRNGQRIQLSENVPGKLTIRSLDRGLLVTPNCSNVISVSVTRE